MDKKKNLLVPIIVLVIAVAAILFVGNKVLNSNTNNEETNNVETNNEETNNEESNNVEYNVIGSYTVKYSEDENIYGPNDYRYDSSNPSTLTLNADNTFVFVWNVCAGMMNTTGKYEVKNNKIILSELHDTEEGLLNTNLSGRTTLEFIIVSDNEIYLDSDKAFGCTIHGNKYGSFIKEN